jgi:hypothetical protein
VSEQWEVFDIVGSRSSSDGSLQGMTQSSLTGAVEKSERLKPRREVFQKLKLKIHRRIDAGINIGLYNKERNVG